MTLSALWGDALAAPDTLDCVHVVVRDLMFVESVGPEPEVEPSSRAVSSAEEITPGENLSVRIRRPAAAASTLALPDTPHHFGR